MVFIGTVLTKTPGVNKAKDIHARLLRKMDHWTDGQMGALVEDTCGAGKSRGARTGEISERNKEESAEMAYDRKVNAGHIRAEVCQATDHGMGGILSVNITDSKTRELVIEVLR